MEILERLKVDHLIRTKLSCKSNFKDKKKTELFSNELHLLLQRVALTQTPIVFVTRLLTSMDVLLFDVAYKNKKRAVSDDFSYQLRSITNFRFSILVNKIN